MINEQTTESEAEYARLLNDAWDIVFAAANTKTSTSNKPVCMCETPNKSETSECVVCMNCGVVLDQLINTAKEYNYTCNDGEKSKNIECTGRSEDPLLPCMSRTTLISSKNGNNSISNTQKWVDGYYIPYEEKMLYKHKQSIMDIISEKSIPVNIVTVVLYKLKEMFNKKNTDGTSIIHRGRIYTGLICVCFYYCCKKMNYNISPTACSKMFSIDTKTFSKCCQIYIMNNEADVVIYKETSIMTRYFGELNLNNKLLQLAIKLMNAADILYMTISTRPQSNIAGVIYFISEKMNLDIDIESITAVIGISHATIKKISNIYIRNEIELYNYIKFYM